MVIKDKTVIFDVDNVLVCPSNHYKYLNMALEHFGYSITEEQFYGVGAMPSKIRLQWLSDNAGLPVELHEDIIAKKYEAQLKDTNLEFNPHLKEIFSKLKDMNVKIGVVSNAKRVFVDHLLKLSGIVQYVDCSVTPDELFHPKPSPSMYQFCMAMLDSSPMSTIIVEDSEVGRTGAYLTGARVHGVTDYMTLTPDFLEVVQDFDIEITVPYISSTLNVLIPMAGSGSRFANVGYTTPKPLVIVNGLPMIQKVIENLNMKANFIFLVLEEHIKKYQIDKYLLSVVDNCNIITVPAVTDGAASTALMAKALIDNDRPLLISNCDQIVVWDSVKAMHKFEESNDDGFILTFHDDHEKWSYASLDENGMVERVAEKKVISNHATTGQYYWKKGGDFVKYAEQMILKNRKVNNEFYIAPVFNEAINDGKTVRIHDVEEMWGIGTPEDLDYYLREYKRK